MTVTVSDFFLQGHEAKKKFVWAGPFGLEVEMEFTNEFPALDFLKEFPSWRLERDGSLQGTSLEFVLREPTSKQNLRVLVDNLYSVLNKNKIKVRDTVRAGVHVHYDVRHLTMQQLFTSVASWICLDPFLVRVAGEGRRNNLFALSSSEAYGYINRIRSFLSSRGSNVVFDDSVRYSSLNLTSLGKYGSIESRSLRTPLKPDVIHNWVEVTSRVVYESCKMFQEPKDIVEIISANGEQFVRAVLGDLADQYVFSVDQYQRILFDSARLVQDFAYECLGDEWAEFTNKKNIATARHLREEMERMVFRAGEPVFRPIPRAVPNPAPEDNF